jgi:hypothetical protein
MSAMMSCSLRQPGRIEIMDKKDPDVGPNDALIRITTTTIAARTPSSRASTQWPRASRWAEPGRHREAGQRRAGYQEGQRVCGAICRLQLVRRTGQRTFAG